MDLIISKKNHSLERLNKLFIYTLKVIGKVY